MKFLRINQLIALLLLSISASIFSDDDAISKQNYKLGGKLTKEVYANRNMVLLNNNIPNDCGYRLRTTLDGNGVWSYGDLLKNPTVEIKMSGRLRYDVGTDAIIKTTPVPVTVVGVPVTIPASSIGKTVPWLRELAMKISLDEHEDGSDHYARFGSFAYELGRGIALGAAYASGGFLGLDPRFSIDQFAPGGLFHTDILDNKLSADAYFSILSNPNSSFKENREEIRTQEILPAGVSTARGSHTGAWLASLSLNWKAITLNDCKLTVNPYLYIHPSPDQKIEFTADTDSTLYGMGTALEFKVGKFEWGFDGAFQGGHSDIKAVDRNLTALVNSDSDAIFQYTKIYTDSGLTLLAPVTDANKVIVATSDKSYTQNGQQIGTSGLYNANDRFRPAQRQNYHGYFWVTDMSYELLEKELKLCFDTGYVSGQLDDLYDANLLTEEQLMNRNFNGYVPIQSVYSGKRIQHLVMLNTGVPRITVENPSLTLNQLHRTSRITGVTTLTDKFTNLAYIGTAFEWKPSMLKDQKVLLKPTAFYYWMVAVPYLADEKTLASHNLGTALSLEFEAVFKECIYLSGYAGLMIPGTQYKQFAAEGLTIGKLGALGSDTAYVMNLSMAYKF